MNFINLFIHLFILFTSKIEFYNLYLFALSYLSNIYHFDIILLSFTKVFFSFILLFVIFYLFIIYSFIYFIYI